MIAYNVASSPKFLSHHSYIQTHYFHLCVINNLLWIWAVVKTEDKWRDKRLFCDKEGQEKRMSWEERRGCEKKRREKETREEKAVTKNKRKGGCDKKKQEKRRLQQEVRRSTQEERKLWWDQKKRQREDAVTRRYRSLERRECDGKRH